MTKHTILFLAANPSGSDPGARVREARSIRAELKRSGYRDRFEFETGWAAEPLDLLRELREIKPTVVHFSGRSGQDGLFFDSAKGHVQVASPAAIAETFNAAGASVRLVVLSASYSEATAEALLAHVDCVVGMSGALDEDIARAFAIGFYGALGEHESVAVAYEHGKAAISLEGLPNVDRPQLRVRRGFDATQHVLAAVRPQVRTELPCPYPGMRPYTADDAQYFHGRAAEIDELLALLRAGKREIYVIGPSGSGKSSLVAAGVLPRLARGTARLGPFLVRTMRPGEHPATRLGELLEVAGGEVSTPANAVAALLAHRAVGASMVIVIDQLEELFTLADTDERERFLTALAALRTEVRCAIIFTLRADFFGAFMESPLWTDRQDRISRIEVGPLRGRALREVIAHPARDLGVLVEPELIERLLADAASEPGVLPILQETLVQLWDRRKGQALTLADYQSLGDRNRSGLAVALSRRADATLNELTSTQVGIARRILLRLISFGEGRSDTRRQQPHSKLRAAGDDAADFEHVLQRMIADRLLATDDDDGGEVQIDLAHEAIIAAWPTLAGWLQARRADEQHRRQLEVAAAQWVARGRGAGGLLDQIVLADAEAWQRTEPARELGLSDDVIALIASSRAAHEKQASAEEANRRQMQRLRAQPHMEAGRLQLLEGHPQEALPYFIAALEEGEEGESLRMLIATATRFLPLLPLLEHQGGVTSAAFSPEGARVVTTSTDNTARIWDAATGRLVASFLEHQGRVRSAAFSPDGTRVVTASTDSTARIWDVATGKSLASPLQHKGGVYYAAFSPDGTRVVTASADNTAQIWDVATGKPLTSPLEHRGLVRSVTFSLDGTCVVTASADKTARVWDATTGKPLSSPLVHRGFVGRAAFSPDGSRVVTASDDHTARIWDVATGKALPPQLIHQKEVNSAAFSFDGTRIVTASVDNTAQVWDASTGKPVTSPLKHQGIVWSAAFSPDGKCIVTASADNTARIWSASTGDLLASWIEHQGTVWSAAFSPDSKRIVTASADNTARIWSASTEIPPVHSILALKQEGLQRLAFDSSGTRVVTANFARISNIWSATTGELLTALPEHQAVASAAFAPDGAQIVNSSTDDISWEASRVPPLAQLHRVPNPAFFRGPRQGVTFTTPSPDGTRIVTVSDDNTVRIRDATTGRRLALPLAHGTHVESVAFSPDGTRIVTTSGTVAQIWDAITGTLLIPPLEHNDDVNRAAFSPDGTRIITTSGMVVQIWDAATGMPLASPLVHHRFVESAALSPDGTRVVTASGDNTAQIWDAITGTPLIPLIFHQRRRQIINTEFSSDGIYVVTVSVAHTARIWDVTTGTTLCSPLVPEDTIHGAAFDLDGTRIIIVNRRTAQIWGVVTGKPLASPLVHENEINSAAFSPDGTRIITVSSDHTARIWDAASSSLLARPLQHQKQVSSAALSPDGTRIVTACDKVAQIWDATTGVPLASPIMHLNEINSVAFSPDGTRIVTASADHTARIWDAATCQPQASPLVHQGGVNTAAFSPDSTRIVTASNDKTAQVWDAASGKPLTSPFTHEEPVMSAAFSPDGTRVITETRHTHTLQAWETRLDETPPAGRAALAARSPFVLSGSVHARRASRAHGT